jgi:hypothetical protein
LLPHYVPVHAYHPTPKVPIGKRKKEKGKASRVCYKGKCSSFADRSE